MQNSSTIPQINIGKKPNEMMNITHFILFPANTPFGNMFLKHTKIVQRLDYVNRKIDWVYQNWNQAVSSEFNPLINITEHLLYLEEIIYFLRVTTDEVIALCFLLYSYKKVGTYPTNLKIHKIGDLKNLFEAKSDEDQEFKEIFLPFKHWLDGLNEVTNAYKHSFINSDLNIIGQNEPCVPCLSLKYNNLDNHSPKFFNIGLTDIITGFNSFYETAIAYAKELSPGHQEGLA